MAAGEIAVWAASVATRELGLFAAAGLLVGGLDDLLIDLIWLGRAIWRDLTIYRIHPRATLETLPPPDRPGRIAIFMGAWREADVIGTTIATALHRFGSEADYRIYVGTYPNDPETETALHQALATNPESTAKVRIVRGAVPGPTSKAEALNRCWDAMLEDERASGPVKAILLHDAEDFVHAGELRLFDWMIERFDLVQIPVRPINAGDRLGISGHCAEMADLRLPLAA